MTALAGHTGSCYSYSFEQACAHLRLEALSISGHSDLTTREGLEIHGDFGRVVEIPRGVGFEGPYSVEVEFTGGVPWPPLDEVDAAMRASREALAAHGLS